MDKITDLLGSEAERERIIQNESSLIIKLKEEMLKVERLVAKQLSLVKPVRQRHNRRRKRKRTR